MRNRKRHINYKKERVVLSDVLPYEVPPYFSNRSFYYFLVDNKIEFIKKDNKEYIKFKNIDDDSLENIIKLLFGINYDRQSENRQDYKWLKLSERKKEYLTIPFKFKISHKNQSFRELVIIHPINQLKLIEFYDRYKSNILFHSSKSKYSLRHPAQVASVKYYRDSTHKQKKSKNEEIEIIETTDKEYTSLRTYFSYKKYSNIFKFYESYEYQRAEKRFGSLLTFDVSRCFDSIYTHSLPWALKNKKVIKDNMNNINNTFGNQFDVIMQQMNYNETNGIVIGPEFSRIFAELILQRIDRNIEKELNTLGIKYKEDYDIYRYVDDFFVFFKKETHKEEIFKICQKHLQEYNLFLNEGKTNTFSKPIITDISVAKEELRKLIEISTIFYFLEEDIKREQFGLKLYSAKDIITHYKSILYRTETSYKDLQNYFLASIYNKVKFLVKEFHKTQKKLFNLYLKQLQLEISEEDKQLISSLEKELRSKKKQIFKNFKEIIELSFFVYTVLPRVSYSIKVCQILFRIIDFIKKQERNLKRYIDPHHIPKLKASELPGLSHIAFTFDEKHILFKKVFENILFVFENQKIDKYVEVETIYLLSIIPELGKYYQLKEELLIKYFEIISEKEVNYFTIMSLLNYVKNDENYSEIKSKLKDKILQKLTTFESNNAEQTILLIDILNCPYLGATIAEKLDFKKRVLNKVNFFPRNVSVKDKESFIFGFKKYMPKLFYSWTDNDLGIELNTKRGHNVY